MPRRSSTAWRPAGSTRSRRKYEAANQLGDGLPRGAGSAHPRNAPEARRRNRHQAHRRDRHAKGQIRGGRALPEAPRIDSAHPGTDVPGAEGPRGRRQYMVIFDKAKDSNMLYTNPKYDVSDRVIKELGYTPGEIVGRRRGRWRGERQEPAGPDGRHPRQGQKTNSTNARNRSPTGSTPASRAVAARSSEATASHHQDDSHHEIHVYLRPHAGRPVVLHRHHRAGQGGAFRSHRHASLLEAMPGSAIASD